MDSAAGQRLAAQGYLGKTNRLLRELGPVALGARLLRRAAHSLVETGSVTFFVRDLGLEERAGPLQAYRLRQFRASDREALLHGSESSWDTLFARFQAGDLCFGAIDEQGRAVHTRWVTLTRARIPELELDLVPAPDAAYFYDGYTRPDARRQGVDAVVRAGIFEALRLLGRSRVYSYVRGDNPAGMRAAGRCQQAVGTIRHARVFGARPWLFGADLKGLAALLHERHPAGLDEAHERAGDWRRWFEGWLKQPLAKRSIGFHELPQAGFEAMAEHIRSTLRLDPARDLVLDLGCDSAMLSRWVAPSCARLVGVDFIADMLVDAQRRRGSEAALPASLCFAAGDGRRLPFPSHTFAKAYCSGVVHTLPSLADGIAMILELVRVARPGGQVLVAAVPDVRKRGQARRAAWRQGGLRDRARMIAAALLPGPLKRLRRRLATEPPLRYLEYDLREIERLLESRGVRCTLLDYPADFWSRDFRATRSSLLIDVPHPGDGHPD